MFHVGKQRNDFSNAVTDTAFDSPMLTNLNSGQVEATAGKLVVLFCMLRKMHQSGSALLLLTFQVSNHAHGFFSPSGNESIIWGPHPM